MLLLYIDCNNGNKLILHLALFVTPIIIISSRYQPQNAKNKNIARATVNHLIVNRENGEGRQI
jgi:hypothetical protein